MSLINVVKLFYGSRYKGSDITKIQDMEKEFYKEHGIMIIPDIRVMGTIMTEHSERTGELTLGQEIRGSIVNG